MLVEHVLIAIFASSNLVALIVMGRDKQKAVRGNHTERTPEGLIFFLAAAFGAVGVYIGMHLFRHKTKTWYFQLGIPLLIIQNVATVYSIWQLLL